MKNKAYVYLLFAAFFRFMGGYSLGYWAKRFFSDNYPEYNNQFSIAYFFILLFGGIPSEIIGGYICDRGQHVHGRDEIRNGRQPIG